MTTSLSSSTSTRASLGIQEGRQAVSLPREHPMVHLLHSELFRLRKRPLSWIMGLLVMATAVVFYVTTGIVATIEGPSSDARDILALSRMTENALQLVSLAGLLVGMVFACGSLGNEFGWGTLRPLVARAGSRADLMTAKWLSLLFVAIVLVTIAFASCIVCAVITNALVGDVGPISSDLLVSWAGAYARVFLAYLPYLALGFVVTLLSRSNAVGIGFGIGIAMLEPALWELLKLTTDAFDTVRKFGLDYPTRRLMDYHSAGDPLMFREGLGQGALALAWTAVFVIVSYIVFRRRDVTL